MADYISQITLPNNVTYDLKDAAALPKSGGILTGGLEVKGHIAGDNSTTTGHGLYSGGMYHNAYNNIILHGDATTGSSGIAFVSDKVNATTGAITNINAPSDRAFIQYHAYGVSTPTAEGTAPTIATSGEAGRLVIGIGNDSGDKIILQAPGTTDIIHQIGVNSYPIPHTTNTNGSVGGTTTPVYVDAGVIKAGTALGGAAYKAENYYALSGHNHDSTYSYTHLSDYDFTDTQPLSKYVTFDKSKPTGAPKEEWYNGFISSHSNYHASYIINGHTNQNEWYVGHGIWREANTPHATAPTWYLLAHSGNVSTGDNNGQVKIAGVNISVKGLGSAAYTETSAYAANSHNHNASDINAGTLSVDRLPEDVVRKRDSFSSSTTELDLVKLNPGMYDFTVNPNNLLPTSYGTILNIHGKYKYGSLIDAATNNVLYYRSYYYNTDSEYEWRGNWQMVAHANSGTAVGGAKIPVYVNATGVITAGDALKALAYKDSLVASDIPNLDWSKITSGKPTTLSGYGITDAKIASGIITLGSNTITPITSVNGHTGSSVSVTAADLGLSKAMRFIGVATVAITDGSTTDPVISGYSTKTAGDVIIDKDSSREYVLSTTGKWELLGGDSSYKTTQSTVDSGAAVTNKWVSRIQQNANGVVTVTMGTLDTSGTWSGNATTATTATNLSAKPSLAASGNNITVTAGGKTSDAFTVPYATSAGSATTATYIKCTDTRSAALNPTDLTAAQGVRFDFKAKGTINLTATDAYAGVMSFRPYASNSDWSGGNAHQLAFNSEGLHWRNGSASWGDWYQILDSDNTTAGANNAATLTWNTTYTIAKINGTDIKFTTMAKPSYAFTDLTAHPTTLGGYGITDAASSSHSHTLKIGNKSLSVSTSEQEWTVHDILYNSSHNIGTDTSWDITEPGVYSVGSNGAFTGEQHPSSNGNQSAPYTYGHAFTIRAGNGGASQFYINHNASESKHSSRGIRYRSGWNVINNPDANHWRSWATILDDKNFNLYAPTLTGTGASGTWDISVTGTAANVTGTVAIEHGGTGKTTASEAWTALGGGASGKHDDNYFAKAAHNHAASDINSGTLDTARLPADVVKVYQRDKIGIAPNFDNPGINGYFEIRNSSETTQESGLKPFNGYGSFLNLQTSVTRMQIAGTQDQWYIRGTQSGSIDTAMSTTQWNRIVLNSGSWDISITGNADTATAAHLTTTTNAIAYYTNTTGTFGSKASANGALYATSANGALQWGILPIAQGGTNKSSWTNFGIVYTDSDGFKQITAGATGNKEQVLISNGAAAPDWYSGLSLAGTAAASYVATFKGTTASISTTTGAVTIAGGLGVAGRITASEINATRKMVISAGKVYSNISGGNVLIPAKTSMLFSDGIAVASPGLTAANDVGWIRMLGEDENTSVLEIATGDDGEEIVVRQYNTSNTIIKEAILLEKATGATSFPVSVTAPTFIGDLTGNADTATKWASAQTVYVALGTASTTTTIQGGSTTAVALGVNGTLAVAHGGTGMTKVSNVNAVVIGNSSNVANTLQTVRTASGAFYATAQDGKPAFGTLPVAQGGTGAVSFTANSLIISGATTTAALTTRGITDRTSVGALTNVATWANSNNIPTVNLIAYWDGRYQTTSNKSNLAYCNKGAFGDMATKTAANYVLKAGDTMTGTLTIKGLKGTNNVDYGTALPTSGTAGQIFFQLSDPFYEIPAGGTTGQVLMKHSDSSRDVYWGTPSAGGILRPDTTTKYYVAGSSLTVENTNPALFNTSIYVENNVLFGAAWNDYAEYRQTTEIIEPGRCVIEDGTDALHLSSARMQAGAEIVSDTYGFAIGQTEKCNTPIAVTGRVLAYPYDDLDKYKPGTPVCSGPDGTVSAMTEEEARQYPWLIIGTVSAIPTYEEWGTNHIKINGRIWIRIR